MYVVSLILTALKHNLNNAAMGQTIEVSHSQSVVYTRKLK